MNPEYVLMFLVLILPLYYKYNFWLYLIQLKDYRWDRFKDFFHTPQWKQALFNIWFFIELPLFLLSFYVFFNSSFEIIFFNQLFYFLIIQNIFVIWKILRKKILKPKKTFRAIIILLLLIITITGTTSYILYNNFFIFIYSYFLWLLLFTPLIIFIINLLTLPLVFLLKYRKYKKASKKSKEINNIKVWITWSFWKTSVKTFLWEILSKENKVLTTPKNINTEMGVSNIILTKLTKKYKYFIAEMWAYSIWEIKTLWNIVNHKYGFITWIWNQHLSLFWSIEKTIKAKSEIAEKVLENNGILYINWANENIKKSKFNKKLNIVKYWTTKSCDARVFNIEIKNAISFFEFEYKEKKYIFETNLIWKHNIINLCWIIAFSIDIWVKINNLKKYLKNLKTPENTLEIIKLKNITLINDSYNLSEDGLFSWLEALNSFDGEKILVVDDILELWKKSKDIHFEIWRKIAEKKLCDKVLFVWTNYRKDFVNWLIFWKFNKENLLTNLNIIGNNGIVLFEWRKTREYIEKITKTNNI